MMDRRRFLQTTAAAGTLTLFAGGDVLATEKKTRVTGWPNPAFDATSEAQALQALFGRSQATPTDKINVKIPELSDGSAVPVRVQSSLSGIEQIALLTPNNERPLNTFVTFSDASVPFSTRIRVERTSPIHVYVKAGGELFVASARIKITRYAGYGMNF